MELKPPSDKHGEARSLIAEIEEVGTGPCMCGPSRFGGRVLTTDEDALILEALKAFASSPQLPK